MDKERITHYCNLVDDLVSKDINIDQYCKSCLRNANRLESKSNVKFAVYIPTINSQNAIKSCPGYLN